MLPDRAEPNIELRNAELPEDPSDRTVLLFANSHYDALLAANKPDWIPLRARRTPHTHSRTMGDWRPNWFPATRCRGNRARGSKEQIFFVREPGTLLEIGDKIQAVAASGLLPPPRDGSRNRANRSPRRRRALRSIYHLRLSTATKPLCPHH